MSVIHWPCIWWRLIDIKYRRICIRHRIIWRSIIRGSRIIGKIRIWRDPDTRGRWNWIGRNLGNQATTSRRYNK